MAKIASFHGGCILSRGLVKVATPGKVYKCLEAC